MYFLEPHTLSAVALGSVSQFTDALLNSAKYGPPFLPKYEKKHDIVFCKVA